VVETIATYTEPTLEAQTLEAALPQPLIRV
jgi:hypothetical protein